MHSKAKNEGHDTSKCEEYMTQPPLVFLRELMGDAWIDANVFGENPKHQLGQNPWVVYTESLVQAILTNEKIRLDRVALAQRLKADYVSTLAEIEAAVFGVVSP